MPAVKLTLWRLAISGRAANVLISTNQTGGGGNFVFHFVPIPQGTLLEIRQQGSSQALQQLAADSSVARVTVAAAPLASFSTSGASSSLGPQKTTIRQSVFSPVSQSTSKSLALSVTTTKAYSSTNGITASQIGTLTTDAALFLTHSSVMETVTTTEDPASTTTETTFTETTSSASATNTKTTRTTFTKTTLTTRTRSASITRTSSSSISYTSSTSKTTFTPDPSSPPVVSNGSTGVLNWQTEWSGEFGNPPGRIQLVCVNEGQNCTSPAVLQTGLFNAANTSQASVIGLEQGKNYTCYAILYPSAGGMICSAGTLVQVSSGVVLSFMHPNGTLWKYDETSSPKKWRLGTGNPVVLRSYASPVDPTSLRWEENFIQFWSNNYNGWLYHNGGNTLGISDGTQSYQREAFQLWHLPDGGTGIRSSMDCWWQYGNIWISWDAETDTISDDCWHLGQPPTLWSWSTNVTLNEAYYSGTVTAAGSFDMPPSATIVGGSLKLTWTKPGNLGTPRAWFFTRCTTLYAPCSPTDPNNMENVPYIQATEEQSLLQKKLTFGESYTCYVVATNTILETCSEGLDLEFSVPPTTPIYKISLANGDSWKLSSDDGFIYTNQGDELQFVMHNSYESGGNWIDGGVQIVAVNTGTNNKWLIENRAGQYGYQLFTEPDCCTAFKIYRSGNGTYAIHTTREGGRYVSRNRVTGRIGIGSEFWLADPNTVAELSWRITPDPPNSLIAGTLAAPSAPVPVGSYTRGATFVASWTMSSWGTPQAKVRIACVAPGQPCNTSTPFKSDWVQWDWPDWQLHRVTGFRANNSQYDCYVIASNILGDACSPAISMTISLPPAPYYNITLQNGTQLSYTPSDNKICIGCAESVPITLARVACPVGNNVEPTYGGCETNHSLIMAPLNDTEFVWLVASGSLALDTSYWTAWTWYKYGSGYALRSGHMRQWVYYNPTDSKLYYQINTAADSGSYLAVFKVTPALPDDWISGTLRPPSSPSVPANGTVTVNSWSSSWTVGADTGFPEAVYKLRCVPSGSNCTATPRYDGEEVSATTTSQTLSSLVVGSVYSCYVVAKNGVGEVCSTSSVTVTVPFYR